MTDRDRSLIFAMWEGVLLGEAGATEMLADKLEDLGLCDEALSVRLFYWASLRKSLRQHGIYLYY